MIGVFIMSTVSIIRCSSYEVEEVRKSVKEAIDLIGGIAKYVKPGMKVMLKSNLLLKKTPDKAATTHPSIVQVVAKLVKEAGATAIIADSPGGLFNEKMLRGIYKVTGMEKAAEESGAVLNYNTGQAEIAHPEGVAIRRMTVMQAINEVDVIINLPKLKTHGMMTYTGAVKNMFGVIPGTTKAEYHLYMSELKIFADMLLDINTLIKPQLTIMDAIVGMEGSGPSAGNPRKIGAVLASEDPFALDVAACKLVSITPLSIMTIKQANERGLASHDINDIDIKGDSIEDLKIKEFKLPETSSVNFLYAWLGENSKFAATINKRFGPRPVVSYSDCVGCSDCANNCPPKAIDMSNGKPRIDLKECIRCYCCQELCPKHAISIKKSFLFKMFK